MHPAFPGHLFVGDAGMVEVLLRELVHAVIRAAGVQHVRDQHRVVVGRDVDAVPREQKPIEFEVLPDLQHARIFK